MTKQPTDPQNQSTISLFLQHGKAVIGKKRGVVGGTFCDEVSEIRRENTLSSASGKGSVVKTTSANQDKFEA